MTRKPTLLVRDPRFQKHVGAPGHPECPDRLAAVDAALAERPELGALVPPRLGEADEILSVHTEAYFSQLSELSGQRAQLDADTYVSPDSFEVARLAVGGALELAARIVAGESDTGFALVRPPGHHAERANAMGFCLFNQVAVVAECLRARHGLERIAIVDWDVHHGNGTQHAFEQERDILFVSSHQFPFYPGTGALRERGIGAGEGATLNLPLPAGCGDAEYLPVFSRVVVPVLDEFRPEMILVSAGFDAHALDPLASMRLSSRAYGELATCLRQVAEVHCDGRMLFLLEGGYHLQALPESVVAVLEALAAPSGSAAVGNRGQTETSSEAAERLVAAYREAHATHWKSLATTGYARS